jgi:hypothetical protein
MVTKRWIATFVAVVAILSLLAACGPTPMPEVVKEVVKETVVVEKEVEVTPEPEPGKEGVRNEEDDVSDILYEPIPETDDGIRRVIDDDEYERMLKYVETYIPEDTVVTSITSEDGDPIACVDVFAQPALRRPGMEDHVIQFEPENILEGKEVEPEESEVRSIQLYQTGEMCPEETIPIRYPDIDILVRFRTLEDYFRKYPSHLLGDEPVGDGKDFHAPRVGSSARHQYAVALQTGLSNWGLESVINLWDPYTEKAAEFSLSQIWASRGGDASLETVEAGWQEYHDKYSDWRPRLFIYFTPDNYGSGGCYNLDCSGFVQVNNTVYIGGGFTNFSQDGGTQYTIKLLWYKDGTNGAWWLRYGNTWVGYYPRSLFDSNGLRNNADRIDFGGEIVDTRTDNRHTRTDMGSGYWPYQSFRKAAYHRSARYVDTNNFYQQATGISRAVTDRECYDLSLYHSSGSWEQYFYFGGSGYNTNCQ